MMDFKVWNKLTQTSIVAARKLTIQVLGVMSGWEIIIRTAYFLMEKKQSIVPLQNQQLDQTNGLHRTN